MKSIGTILHVPSASSIDDVEVRAESISDVFQARARPFLDLVDAMRKDGVEKAIAIPQIAVMGDQSSGKSSVLEQITGVQFPRGSGLVTRCATQITMEKFAASRILQTGTSNSSDISKS
jgi:hypothetical protein